ncbi:MAG: hypothetical protein E7E23_19915 [Paenibacillus sp.]|uniref:hypothetical protein n=1 Tax=Paenibacillus sp. TaxID=58172 RepID=UPI0028FFE8C5|nr:hypothetical protein [Paenibacillus sp.]MDU2242835.1 hypothetical protein [Paenibacillus sp.]
MQSKDKLLLRLDEIGTALEKREDALLLLGLGSIGAETARLDEFSDLDFFLLVAPGSKERFIRRLDWLEEAHPLCYSFMNAPVGYKILFQDGIYAEFAVFEEHELKEASYAGGRVVWRISSAAELKVPLANTSRIPPVRNESVDFALNEALTNLYVGLGRYIRGEKLSAFRFVQVYAINSILSVQHLLEPEVDHFPDPFGNERRAESRFPGLAEHLPVMLQGYVRLPESALQILDFLESVYPVNQPLSEAIRQLARRAVARR